METWFGDEAGGQKSPLRWGGGMGGGQGALVPSRVAVPTLAAPQAGAPPTPPAPSHSWKRAQDQRKCVSKSL